MSKHDITPSDAELRSAPVGASKQLRPKAFWEAGALALIPAVLGWLGTSSSFGANHPIGELFLGIMIQLPAMLILGLFALFAPGGIHNNSHYFRAAPVLTWAFYWWLSYRLISARGERPPSAAGDPPGGTQNHGRNIHDQQR